MLSNSFIFHSTILALLICLPVSASAVPVCEQQLSYMLNTGLHPYLPDKDFSAHRETVRQFYALHEQQLAWFREWQLTPQAHSFLLSSNDPEMKLLQESILAANQDKNVSRCQLSLYDAAITIGGLRNLQSTVPGQQHLAEQLFELSRQVPAEHQSDTLKSDFPTSMQLQQALQAYRELSIDPALSISLPLPDKSLHPGDSYPAIAQLAYKLQRLGDLEIDSVDNFDSEIYTDGLAAAVKRFQARHGLNVDGVLGKKTFRALNTPISERLQQLEASLLRWRDLPLDTTRERLLVVNIPQYKLFAFERTHNNYVQTLEMKVIVGKSGPKHETPVMSGEMTYIVFSPYWNIPYKIVRDEIHPKIMADSDYLASHGYQIVEEFSANAQVLDPSEANIEKLLSGELLLRQINGRKNTLGGAKFMFPNEYAVYMHGTQSTSLFNRSKRDFSHGCVRLADPAGLAEYVLGEEWPRERIDKLIQREKRKVISLTSSLPVYMMYATAAVGNDGKVHFAQDIYQLDQKMAQQRHSTQEINHPRRVPDQYPDG